MNHDNLKSRNNCAQLLAAMTMAAVIVMLSWASLSHAKVAITLAEPDWEMSFRPLQNSNSTPKLKIDEHALLDQLRPLLNKKSYTKALKLLQNQWPEQASAAMFYIRAQIATQLKQYKNAEQDYLSSIKKHGDYLLARQSLAGLSLSQNHAEKAQQHLAQSIALGGSSAALFGQLGYLNLRFHSAFSSVAAYQRAYALEPQNKHWQQGLLMALSRSGAHLQANSLIDELLEDTPSNSELWLHKANAAMAG